MLRLLTNARIARAKVLDLVSSSLQVGFGRHLNHPPPSILALATVDLCPSPIPAARENSASASPSPSPSIADCLWLAVPKSKISRSKKRMKTTTQKRISKKENIIVDSRTGEITLRHKLPFNWKDYLPDN
mmetsp:Transcript_9250/g.13842  ORF Transcript_9250/g.13842 Transcript_9250/m.13842 type:complete len:130 (+) Transcript_9250:119-508(+)